MRHTLRTAVLVTVAATIYLAAQLPSAGQVAEQMRLFTTRLATRDRVALLRQEALVVEPYAAALPVAPPPAQ